MSTYQDFKNLTAGLGLENDCPVCGYSWPGCRGMCVAHEAMNGQMGPYHTDFNDDCNMCNAGHICCADNSWHPESKAACLYCHDYEMVD